MMFLQKEIDQLESYFGEADKHKASVSTVGVAWHLNHCFKVIVSIYKAVSNSDPAAYKAKFNFKKTFVLTTGYIPRGRGKAPEAVKIEATVPIEELKKHLEKAKKYAGQMEQLESNNYFEHPYFGQLNLKDAQQFIIVHTKHHLKIIRDIVA